MLKLAKKYLILKLILLSLVLLFSLKEIAPIIAEIGVVNFTMLLMQNEAKTPVTKPVRVIKVVDGNTLLVKVLLDRKEPIEVNLSEVSVSKKDNKKATDYLKSQVLDKVVFIEKDSNGKINGYIWTKAPLKNGAKEVEKYLLNSKIINEGYAKQNPVSSNKKYKSLIATIGNTVNR